MSFAEPTTHWTTSFFLDNDLFASEDDGYTNGIRLSFVSPNLNDFEEDKRLPQWLRSFNKRVRLLRSDDDATQNMVITIGQQIFTPDEQFIDAEELIEGDRPYAGWLYLGLGYQFNHRDYLAAAIVNIGVVGPASYAQQSQDAVHSLRGFDKFDGWDNQLDNELGLQLLYHYKHKLFHPNKHETLQTDLIGQWGASLGNIATYLETGVEWRLGWRLPDDFGTSSASPGGDNSAPRRLNNTERTNGLVTGLHFYAAINGRWVLRDITLDGNTFTDSHSVDKNPLVGSFSTGISVQMNRWRLGFSRTYVSKEFKGQLTSRGYGSVSISYTRTL